MADIFGKINSIYLAHSKDEDVRFKASSGGFVKSFLCYLLDSFVDYVIITRTGGQESPLKPETIITDSKEDILSTRTNSVYCVNNPFKVFGGIRPDKKYAFVALPCQVTRAREYNIDVIISLFCNHAPLPAFTHNTLSKLGISECDVKQIEYRGNGWPGYFTAYLKTGEVIRVPLRSVWNTLFMPAKCKSCSEIGQNADIAVGDPWRISKTSESLVICRNKRADDLVKKADTIKLKPVSFDQLNKSQGKHFIRKGSNERI
jgi:coenzyme F420 hydrogenase subunit beta